MENAMLLRLCPWNLLDTCNGGFRWLVLKCSMSVAKLVINRMAGTSSLPREEPDACTVGIVRGDMSAQNARGLKVVRREQMPTRLRWGNVRRDLSART